jgi:DNA polymerase-3 subunit delta'
VPLVPVYGHAALRARLLDAHARGALPASLLLHGPRGVGKQRLALWLGQALVCGGDAAARPAGAPCGRCQHCRYADQLAHPDLAWFFPRPRLKDADAGPDDVRADYAEARAERAARHALYPPSAGTEALYVATVRALVQQAAVSPAMARRKVFVVGDAERMVAQEGRRPGGQRVPQAARGAAGRHHAGAHVERARGAAADHPVARGERARATVAEVDVRAFLADPQVRAALDAAGGAGDDDARLRRRAARRAPPRRGRAGRGRRRGRPAAARGHRGDRAERLRAAFGQGASKARGAFSDVLDALTVQLHALARDGAARARPTTPRRATPAGARGRARGRRGGARQGARAGNVNPQLVSAELVRELAEALR